MSTKQVNIPSIQGAGKIIPCGDDWAIVVNKREGYRVQVYQFDFIDLQKGGWTCFFACNHFVKEPHIHVYRKDEGK